MIKTIIQAFKMKEVRTKILWTFFLLLIYRIGCFIPVPGINPDAFHQSWNESKASGFLNILNSVAGGALKNGAILALGVGPYITSSIVIQLLAVALPPLQRLSKQGDEGKRKMATYTRYAALVMALAQAVAIAVSFNLSGELKKGLFGTMVPHVVVVLIVILTLTAGAMFTVWIGDKITELGVANGMSMLIFVGIISTAAQAFVSSIVDVFKGDIDAIVTPIVFLVTLATIFSLIVFIDLGERKIPVSYAKQNRGNKLYGGQSTHIPLKVLAVGVMPIIFAFSLLNFPQVIFSFFPNSEAMAKYTYWVGAGGDGPGRYINAILTSLLILGFSYFYASIIFDPHEISVNLQQNGGYILGFRPGAPTRDYLRKVYNRMTFFGAIFLAFMALIPSIIFSAALQGKGGTLTDSFSGIGMLIVVSVALEFDKQLQAAMMMKSYKGFLK